MAYVLGGLSLWIKSARSSVAAIWLKLKGRTPSLKSWLSLLHSVGYRFRLHSAQLPWKPDIILPKHKTVVFVHGCFRHGHTGCKRATIPATRPEFWEKKISGNKERDTRNIAAPAELGYRCFIVWQCELKDVEVLKQRLSDFLGGK